MAAFQWRQPSALREAVRRTRIRAIQRFPGISIRQPAVHELRIGRWIANLPRSVIELSERTFEPLGCAGVFRSARAGIFRAAIILGSDAELFRSTLDGARLFGAARTRIFCAPIVLGSAPELFRSPLVLGPALLGRRFELLRWTFRRFGRPFEFLRRTFWPRRRTPPVMMKRDIQNAARLEVRLPNETLARLKRAAEIQGRTLTDFVVTAADEAPCQAIEQTEIIRLSIEDHGQIFEALLNPPEPTRALKRAFQRRRELLGVE